MLAKLDAANGERNMATDSRDLLSVLKAELHFAEMGGYRETSRVPWRPQFIFQDSPTCINLDSTKPRRPCDECAIVQLVPEKSRTEKIPCRHIVLNERGETIDWFYRTSTAEELEVALIHWLKATIQKLEAQSERERHGTEALAQSA
jgi:hypothetical protein